MICLLLVDIQNDFLPGGALAVPCGDEVIPVANSLMAEADLVVATQDWHPPGHGSFASTHGAEVGSVIDLDGLEQVLWPDHCVSGSAGALFGPGLETNGIDHVVRKGTDPRVDSYSGFFDNGRRHDTGLADYLRGTGVSEVLVAGLATDYCVKWTALDAASLGFRTTVVGAGCRGVELNPGDVDRAWTEMAEAGIHV